jgi:predicted enzyme related to lactoylglutathione lyase
MLNGYAYITVLVNDQDQALKFYQETLGLELRMDVPFSPEERWVTVAPVGADYPEISLEVAVSPAQKNAIGQQAGDTVLVVFTTENADQSHADLTAKGVQVLGEPENVPWGRQFALKDPYGNLISVLQPAPR